MTPEEELLDYRRSVSDIYSSVRNSQIDNSTRWQRFREARDQLLCTHVQSALSLEQKAAFSGLHYYPYDPAYRFIVPVEPDPEPETLDIHLKYDGTMRMRRFGKVQFAVQGQPLALSVYWIEGYGGGIFLPFGDLTNNHETYGGGRYLLDTIKHADLGHEDGQLVIDFNYAYNPSCAYNGRWYCPLAPAENRLPIAIHAGEQSYHDFALA